MGGKRVVGSREGIKRVRGEIIAVLDAASVVLDVVVAAALVRG